MALPLLPILLGVGLVALAVKAAKSTPSTTTPGTTPGTGGHVCPYNGEQLSAVLAQLDMLSASTGGTKTGTVIMAALSNPLAKASDLRALATATRNLKMIGFKEADNVGDCIDARADAQAAAGNP